MKTASRIKMAATVASLVRASRRPGAPSVAERAQAVPRLVRSTLEGTYAGTTVRRLGLVAAAVVYVASPVDLLPEAMLPVLGAADDAVVISWAVKAFLEETDRFIAWEIGQGLHRPDPTRGSGGWGRSGPAFGSDGSSGPSSSSQGPYAASGPTVPGVALHPTVGPDARASAGGVDDGLRRDRDATGAAAPGRIVSRVTRLASGARPTAGPGGAGANDGSRTGPGRPGRVRLPEGARQAATDYVLESVRKRLER